MAKGHYEERPVYSNGIQVGTTKVWVKDPEPKPGKRAPKKKPKKKSSPPLPGDPPEPPTSKKDSKKIARRAMREREKEVLGKKAARQAAKSAAEAKQAEEKTLMDATASLWMQHQERKVGEAREAKKSNSQTLAAKRRKVRELRRRQARLHKNDAEQDRQDAVNSKLRAARKSKNARSDVYEGLKRRHHLEQVRLQQMRDQMKSNKQTGRSALSDLTNQVAPQQVIGDTGNKKQDKRLKKKGIADTVRDIRAKQKRMGSAAVDRGELRILDARVNWLSARLAGRMDALVKQAKKLEAKASAKGATRADRKRFYDYVTSPEVKQVFKEKDLLFGSGPDGAGEFDVYWRTRQRIESSYVNYWTDHFKTLTKSREGIAAQLDRSRGVPSTEEDLLKTIGAETPELSVPGDGSEASMQVLANNTVGEMIRTNPALKWMNNLSRQDKERKASLHEYFKTAGEKAGFEFEDYELVNPDKVNALWDVVKDQFNKDWEAEHGGEVDTGFNIAGPFGHIPIIINSGEEKRRSDEYWKAEEELHKKFYELYQDRDKGWLGQIVEASFENIGLPAMEMLGAAVGGIWSDLRGDFQSGRAKPVFFDEIKKDPTVEAALGSGASEDVLKMLTVPEEELRAALDAHEKMDVSSIELTDADIQEMVDNGRLEQTLAEINSYEGQGRGVSGGLNLDLNAARGGANDEEILQFAREQGLNPMLYLTDGELDRQKWDKLVDSDYAVRQAYFSKHPESQGLWIPPEHQMNTPPDSQIINGRDVGLSALHQEADIRQQFQEDFHGADATDVLGRARALNEVPGQMLREPGGGALSPGVANWFVDPLMLAKVGRLPQIARYALNKGTGLRGVSGVFTKQLVNHRFGFKLPGHGIMDNVYGAPDEVGMFNIQRSLAKDLHKAYQTKSFSSAEMEKMLDDFVRKNGVDPRSISSEESWRKKFFAEVERKTGKAPVSTKQIQSATQKYMRKRLALDGVDIIEQADQARLLKRADDLNTIAETNAAAKKQAPARAARQAKQRGAAHQAAEKRHSTGGYKRHSPFEAADDFLDDATGSGDFRAPKPHKTRGGFSERYYGKGLSKGRTDSTSVVVMGTARHAPDLIAIADNIARRYHVAVRWAANPRALGKGKGASVVVEVYGGTREAMAQVADELDTLTRQHRRGQKTKNATWRAYDKSDGRVLYRDTFADSALDDLAAKGDPGGISASRDIERIRGKRNLKDRARRMLDEG
ncbi:MAG: hypothetical protein DRR06_15570, partial [Gammaproteobacteria bacterium]